MDIPHLSSPAEGALPCVPTLANKISLLVATEFFPLVKRMKRRYLSPFLLLDVDANSPVTILQL